MECFFFVFSFFLMIVPIPLLCAFAESILAVAILDFLNSQKSYIRGVELLSVSSNLSYLVYPTIVNIPRGSTPHSTDYS